MDSRLFYVPVVSDEALDLAEDIQHLALAKELVLKTRGRNIDNERVDEVFNRINELERELRYLLRHRYLDQKPIQVSEALRQRIRHEVKKERL
jgi:benzoyl-CoA reductase/2-hydroxyglutaryl-CoA dehydratase subunit BcrC/BadD/HgdB